MRQCQHVSYFEADAFATWKRQTTPPPSLNGRQRRNSRPLRASFCGLAAAAAPCRLPGPGARAWRCLVMYGNGRAVHFLPIPDSGPCAGAVGEYNRKIHVRSVRPARRLVRDTGEAYSRDLSQFLPSRHSLAEFWCAPLLRDA